ncbi:bifunctional (p)ppGpp synthetase/guanosine-3',5'-bis(diphosphate) 3'-pyrophosphohydrolase [Moraxella sp.]|uniref:RelA/SpoT family protein n=1 Tax=Moraxella sp. TaxID=479 RepID=UPI0026DB6B6A|nr:HD domain-containing protein [Moraxella sp.]MDO4895547.1 HD domain-containing protein [Moraxella sp.]
MSYQYQPNAIPESLSHPLVDEARDGLMQAVSYLSASERQDVLRACYFGDVAHILDKRKSGEPYITHPIAVAEILAGFRLDRDTIIAAILHDTVEDTEVTEELLVQEFGEVVARLVDGVTKLKSSTMNKQQSQAATFHKILTATLIDPRVLIVKLSDRLHNMSTLDAVRPDKKIRTASETLDFYVPFARVMGLNNIADYIELLCYRNLNESMYNKFSDKLLQHGLGRQFQKTEISTYLQSLLAQLNLNGHVQVLDNRPSMYRQFFKNRGEINRLIRQYDFEVVLDDIESCDKLANHLIRQYQIQDKQIQDNIRKPLAGGNQSLTLIYEKDYNHIKVTLMTKRMQEAARLGVISRDRTDVSHSVIQASLRNMQDLASSGNLNDSEAQIEIINELISYLHERKIVCYSPQGHAYELPRGATALDFAYAVGPAIGNIATGADINNQHGRLGNVLADGDTVSIDTDPNARPQARWLGFVATNKARSEILKYLKHLPESDKILYGKQALDQALQPYDKSINDINADDWANILAWRGLQHSDELFIQLATGVLLPQLVVSRLFSEEVDSADKQAITQSKHLLAGIKGVEVDFARCCNPIYGDGIVGHISRQGLVVHRHKCYSLAAIRTDNPYQVIQLNWKADIPNNQNHQLHFPATLRIYAMLNEEQISQAIYELRALNIGVETTAVKADKDQEKDSKIGTTTLQIVVRSRAHLEEGIDKLRQLLDYPNIMRLYQ